MVEVCYDRMTEILSCREFSAGRLRGFVENANFISCKILHALPKVLVDVSSAPTGDLRGKAAAVY
jgi:hypothetical protein